MPLGLEIGAKEILISKDEKGYGLHVHGQNPVTIKNVAKDGPAYRAGARIGDQIIKVNGEHVGSASHEKVVRMIKDQKFVRLVVRPCSECPDSPCSSEASIPPAVPVRHRSNASSVVVDAAVAGAAPPKLPSRSISDGLLKLAAEQVATGQSGAPAVGGGSGGSGGKSTNEIKRRSTTKALRKKRAQITISGHWTPSSSCDAESSEFKSVQQHGEDIMKKMAIEAYQDVLKSVKLCSGSGDNQHQSTIDWTETEKLFARLRTLLDRCCPRPAGFCPVELALEFANAAQLPLLPPAAVAALKASAVGAPAVSSATPTRIDLHFEPGMSTDTGSPVSTPRSPMPLVVTAAVDIDDAASLASSADKRIPREPTGLRASQSDECDDDEEEPDIDISSFMSCDPNFNRETPDSQSMEKALETLKTYLSGYVRMKQFKPAMLVFLHSLLAKKEAKWYKPLNFVLFDWIADDWRRREFPPKQAKRTAYALYATYLHRDAPLNLQASLQATDPELGLPRLELADSVRGLTELFTKQPTDAQVERISTRLNDLQDRLAPLGDILVRSIGQEVLAKRRDGFVSDILPAIDSLREDLSEEKQQLFLNKSRPIMQAHLQFLASASFGGDLEAGCLATVLEHVFHLRPGDTAANDFWPAAVLNCPRQSRGGAGRRSSATFEKRGPHLLRLVELDRLHPCSACGRLLAGPGPQGYVCTVGDCEVAAHKSCMDKVKPISCTTSKLSILARSLSSSRESMPPGSQKPPQPPPHAQHPSQHPASSQAMSSSLDSDGLLRQQQQNLRRQSQQSSDLASAIQVVDLPEADSIATAAALGRQSRSPSLQPLSPANGELSATPSAAAADSESDQAKDESSQQARTPQPQPLAPSDHVSGHPDIRSVQVDFHAYIMDMDLNGRLAELRKTYDKDFDRLKEYQLALHEMVFSSMSHLRALTILQQLFVQHWPAAYKETLNQLGLHFVPDCIALYKSLLASLRGPSLEEFRNSACLLEQFGERLLAWYTADDHVFEFKRLSLSFGFAKTATKRKTSNINEDDIILKLISLRRDNQDFNGFFSRAEAHPVMNKRRFVDLYSVNMQQTMRMVTLLDAAVKKAKKAKSACSFAAKDAENLEACLSIAKDISDYSNNIGVKLKELSRQLVLSKSFSNFWEKSMMDESQVHRFRNQISHLHTCRLYLTREVHMPGLDNYRLRLFVFTEFLLVISESDENRTTKYQLLKHLGPSMSLASQQQHQQQQQQLQQQQPQSLPLPQTPAPSEQPAPGHASLIAVSCPPIIPMESVVHIFDTDTENRRKLDQIGGGSSSRARCAEFRIIIEQTLDNSGRVKPLMLEFRVSQDRPRMPFLANEASSPASEFAECIRKLAPRLSSRLDRHSSMAGSSTDLTRGPAVSAVSAVASAPAATSAATPAASTEATERHRRANSHAGMAIAAAAVAAEPPLPEQQQQEQELDEQQQPAARPEVEESSDSSSRIADTEAAPESDEPAAASAVSPVSGVQQSVENFQRQSELMREQRACLTQIVAEQRLLPSNQSAKILAAWRLVEQAHSAVGEIVSRLMAVSSCSDAAAAADAENYDCNADSSRLVMADSLLAGVAAAARAAAQCIEEPSTWAAAAGSYYSADLPPPTPVAGDEVSADVATLKRALQAVNSAKDSRFNSSSSGGNANRGDASPDDNNAVVFGFRLSNLSSSLTAPDGSDISGSQTPPPSDFVVVERRAQINPRDASGGSSGSSGSSGEAENDGEDDEDSTEEGGSGSGSSGDGADGSGQQRAS